MGYSPCTAKGHTSPAGNVNGGAGTGSPVVAEPVAAVAVPACVAALAGVAALADAVALAVAGRPIPAANASESAAVPGPMVREMRLMSSFDLAFRAPRRHLEDM